MPRNASPSGGGLFGAKWWQVVSACGVIAGIVFGVIRLVPSDPSPVLFEDPDYGPVQSNSQCSGDWMLTEYLPCEDTGNPQYEQVTSAEICGTSTVTEVQEVQGFSECRNPSHGVEGYRQTRNFERWSAWRSGGYNRTAWCNEVRADVEVELGHAVEWNVLRTDEQSKADILRHFEYKYYCQGSASWDPIYRLARTASCGQEQPRSVNVEAPNTCDDPTTRFFPISKRAECGESPVPVFLAGARTAEALSLIARAEVASYRCSSCEAFAEVPAKRLECLLASAYFYLEAGDKDGVQMIRGKLIAHQSHSSSMPRGDKRRLKNQLAFIDQFLD